jgi:hypothetical protein
LVKAYSQTGSARIAAKEAGMHVNNAYIALRTPEVQAAVMREQMYILRVEGVPVAIKALIDVASNPKERGSSRAQAAKIILDQAKDQPGGSDKSIDQMTADEMQAQLDEIRSRRAELATVIDAVVIEPEEGGALD